MIGIKDQCFGVEIELTGITRAEAAEALAAYFETTPQRSYRYGVYQELRSHLLGGLCHSAGVYYLFTIRIQPARRNGRTCPGNGRLELYWRTGV